MKIKLRSIQKYKYELTGDYKVRIKPLGEIREPVEKAYIILSANGDILIKSGYQWDGPSGPTFDTENFMRASLVHDALYQLLRAGRIGKDCRAYADQLLYDMCIEDGMSILRARCVFMAVRFFGWIVT